jgi:thiamine biosynthesis lipoprotein
VSAIASRSFRALGTDAAVYVTRPEAIGSATAAVEAELTAIDDACSRFRANSELSLLNRAGGRATAVSPLLAEAIAAALRAAELTDGDVDPTVGRALRAIGYDRDFDLLRASPPARLQVRASTMSGWRAVSFDPERRLVRLPAGVELDVGATAKALAADRAALAARTASGAGVLVNLGGDLAIAGPAPAGGWPVRVTDDHAAPAAAAGQDVRVSSGGLATSSAVARRWPTGSGERHHIVDPRTGDSAAVVWRTVSVAAGSCLDANIAATAAIVRGEPAPAWLDGLGLPARLVRPSGAARAIAGWPREAS